MKKTIHQKLDALEIALKHLAKQLNSVEKTQGTISMADTKITADVAALKSALTDMETRLTAEIETAKANGVSADDLAGIEAVTAELGVFGVAVPVPVNPVDPPAPEPSPAPAPPQTKHRK